MLKQRVLTALILVPVAVATALWVATPMLAVVLGALALLGAWEWTNFMQLTAHWMRLAYCVLFLAIMGATAFVWIFSPPWAAFILWASLGWWLLSMLWLSRLRYQLPRVVKGVAGLFTLVPAWLALVMVHAQRPAGAALFLFLFVLVWVADSGAFFFGRYFGRHRLAPAVSPGKTWEGVLGGELAAAAVAVVGAFSFNASIVGFVVLGVLVVAFSVVGDLSESLFKRQAGLKDSGAIFPGHGGLLDRIDSLTAAAPTFVLGLMALSQFR